MLVAVEHEAPFVPALPVAGQTPGKLPVQSVGSQEEHVETGNVPIKAGVQELPLQQVQRQHDPLAQAAVVAAAQAPEQE